MQPLQCDLQPPFIKVKSQSHTTLQGQVSIAHHPSRSSLNRTPPFKVNSQSRTTLQGQVSIAHHPSRSSLNRTPPFKVNSQSHTTLQGQVSIAHHPSRSSLNRTPPFKVKSQSRATLQGQVSIAHHPSHHPSRSSVNRAPPFLNRAPPFKGKSQSHTTLQGQVSIAHHPSSFQDSEFYLSVPRKYCFPTSFDDAHFVFCFLFVVINLFPLLVHTQETLAECGAAIRLKSTVCGPKAADTNIGVRQHRRPVSYSYSDCLSQDPWMYSVDLAHHQIHLDFYPLVI